MLHTKALFVDKVDCVPCQINKRYHMTNFTAITVQLKGIEVLASVFRKAI